MSNVQENECPSCVLQGKRGSQMKKETDPVKKTTTTVMGEEDIGPEIEERSESFYRARAVEEIVSSTSDVRVRGQELLLLDRDIERKKRDRFFLTTEAQRDAYREGRKRDIVAAIIAARENEDK